MDAAMHSGGERPGEAPRTGSRISCVGIDRRQESTALVSKISLCRRAFFKTDPGQILPIYKAAIRRKGQGMDFKRITLLSGHYGSGKTNIAVNLALQLRKSRERVAIADVDIVNPYFRSKDSQAELEKAGVRLICSEFASSNVDLPALPQDVYAITDDPGLTAVIDVGGDDRGALALGRWRDAILAEDNYEMLLVVNRFRPLTRHAASTLEVLREIEAACRMPFTAVVNNSNLGPETTAETVLASQDYAREVCRLSGLPLKMTTVPEQLYPGLKGQIEDLFPLELQEKIV